MLKQRFGKKGFTMAELLIVIAIIAILVAIALPVFGAQLNKARAAVELANVRSAYSEAVVDALLDGENGELDPKSEVAVKMDDLAKALTYEDDTTITYTAAVKNEESGEVTTPGKITVTYKGISGEFTIDNDVTVDKNSNK